MDEIVLCAIEISPVLLFWLVIFVNRSVITSVSQFGFVIGSATLLEWNPFGITDVQLYSNSSASVLIPIFVCSAFHCWLNTRRRDRRQRWAFSSGWRDRQRGRAVSLGRTNPRRGRAFSWGASSGDVKTGKSMRFSFPCSYSVSDFLGFRSVFGLQITCRISLHGERARDVLCVMCERTRVLCMEIRNRCLLMFSSPLSVCMRLLSD